MEYEDCGSECSMCGKPMPYRYCGMCTTCEMIDNDVPEYTVEVCPRGHTGRGILLSESVVIDQNGDAVEYSLWQCELCGETWHETL